MKKIRKRSINWVKNTVQINSCGCSNPRRSFSGIAVTDASYNSFSSEERVINANNQGK